MGQSSELQTVLEEVLGSPNVYFQPPASAQMKYPAITFHRDSGNTEFADNRPYSFAQRYQVTYIDRKPDSDMIKKIAMLPTCVYSTFFVADGLNHDVFTLYF